MSCLSWLFSPPFVIIITITKMVALENLDCNDLNLNSLKKLKWKNKNQDMLKCWNGIHNGGKFLCRNNWHVPFLNPFMWLNFNSNFFDIQPFLEQLVIHMNAWGFNSQNDHSQLRTLPSKATSWTPWSKLSTLTILLVFWQ